MDRNKNFTRVIYSLACIAFGVKMFKRLVIVEKSIIGVIITLVMLLASLMFLDRSNYLPIKISKGDLEPFISSMDLAGFIIVVYLFFTMD